MSKREITLPLTLNHRVGGLNFSTYAALSLRTDSLEAGEATSGSEGIF